MAQKIYQQDLLDDAFKPKNDMLTVPTKNIPSVADVIGKTLPLIGKYNDLGRRLSIISSYFRNFFFSYQLWNFSNKLWVTHKRQQATRRCIGWSWHVHQLWKMLHDM